MKIFQSEFRGRSVIEIDCSREVGGQSTESIQSRGLVKRERGRVFSTSNFWNMVIDFLDLQVVRIMVASQLW